MCPFTSIFQKVGPKDLMSGGEGWNRGPGQKERSEPAVIR